MGIGVDAIIPTITSDDLQDLQDYNEGKKWIRDSVSDEEEYEELYPAEWWDRMETIKQALKGKIKWDEYYDWKQFEWMQETINNKRDRKSPYKYFYNASPGQDGIYLMLSKIELPSAESAED